MPMMLQRPSLVKSRPDEKPVSVLFTVAFVPVDCHPMIRPSALAFAGCVIASLPACDRKEHATGSGPVSAASSAGSTSPRAPTDAPLPWSEPRCVATCTTMKGRTLTCLEAKTFHLPAYIAPAVRRWLRAEASQLDCKADCPFWSENEITRIDSCNEATACEAFTNCIASGTASGVQTNSSTRLRAKDGATMVLVPSGPFYRGSPDGFGEDDEHPGGMVELGAYWIDRTEVTTANYEGCMTSGACKPTKGGMHCNAAKEGRERRPINCVTWYDAEAYCKWAGAALPTEAQWEKAARGPAGRVFPWTGFLISCDKAVWYDPDLGYACGQRAPWSVGSKPGGASPYGAEDMVGNVWEWVADTYDPGFYASGGTTNPANADKGAMGIMRGGGWGKDAWEGWAASNRFKFARGNATEGIGFRCAQASGSESAR